VAIIAIQNVHHDWPTAAMTEQISTTDATWKFFARHPKP
jgi:hypothetical protein